MIIGYEFNQTRGDIAEIRKDMNANNVRIIEEIGNVGKQVAVTNQKIDDLKETLKH